MIKSLTFLSATLLSTTATIPLASASDRSNDFIDIHPSGCEYIQRRIVNGKNRFAFVQPCSRNDTGWEQGLANVKSISKTLIYVKDQPLIDGGLANGYFCSVSSIPKKTIFAKCTSGGWKTSR